MSIKVSVVMPVYNAIKYIDKAIMSILTQTYQNFELIIIDDGATDGTSERCCFYKENFPFVRYIKQENKGVCAARNLGISLAKGEYVAFSDHDDEYFPKYLEILCNAAEKYDVEVVKCGVVFEDECAGGKVRSRTESFKSRVLEKKELVKEYTTLPICFFGVWNTLYKLDFLQKNAIEFPLAMKYGQEDFSFNTRMIPHLTTICFVSECLYKHFRRHSQSTSAKFYEDRIDAIAEYFKEESCLKLFVSTGEWRDISATLYAQKITGILSYVFATIEKGAFTSGKRALERFVELCPCDSDISQLRKIKLKYILVLYLMTRKQYDLLLAAWCFKMNIKKN